ncbi:MAG: hypothetical protein A2X40_01300 [Elusimicrobia bacterium GWC2_65_9]|nr:MAG: hypothetical protein A2X37_08760 [Elusimicrobia bacterium GWA2_66_18]OGR76464.1 MAG: hypothetical protein A2X40_01300 [Elusimicrobia bacterium GWC2_65_9]
MRRCGKEMKLRILTLRRLNRATVLLLLALAPVRAAGVARIPRLAFATGQVIAISEMKADPSTLLFEAATSSRYGHLGVVADTAEGLMVYHSVPRHVQKTPLADFLARARVNGRLDPPFTLLRHAEPLTHAERSDLVKVMDDMVARKVPFNYSMAMNPSSVNCSELVRRVFEAIGRSGLGEVGPIGRHYGAFDGALLPIFKISRPPEGSLGVSPASIVHSPQLEVVYAKLPVDRMVSDAEIFNAWKDGGGLDQLARVTRIPRGKLIEDLGKAASDRPARDYPSTWRPPRR